MNTFLGVILTDLIKISFRQSQSLLKKGVELAYIIYLVFQFLKDQQNQNIRVKIQVESTCDPHNVIHVKRFGKKHDLF